MINEDFPEMKKAKKTLDIVAETLSNANVDYVVVGRFAKTFLGENKGRRFDENSDLDIAVQEGDLEKAAQILLRSNIFSELKAGKSYNKRSPSFPAYLLSGRDYTPVHLSGSLSKERTNEYKTINRVTYFPHHLSFGKPEKE